MKPIPMRTDSTVCVCQREWSWHLHHEGYHPASSIEKTHHPFSTRFGAKNSMRHGASIQRLPCPLHRLYRRFGGFAVLRVCKKSQKTAQDVSFTNQWPQQVHEVCAKKPRTGQERNAMSKQNVRQKRCYMSFTCTQGQVVAFLTFTLYSSKRLRG